MRFTGFTAGAVEFQSHLTPDMQQFEMDVELPNKAVSYVSTISSLPKYALTTYI